MGKSTSRRSVLLDLLNFLISQLSLREKLHYQPEVPSFYNKVRSLRIIDSHELIELTLLTCYLRHVMSLTRLLIILNRIQFILQRLYRLRSKVAISFSKWVVIRDGNAGKCQIILISYDSIKSASFNN